MTHNPRETDVTPSQHFDPFMSISHPNDHSYRYKPSVLPLKARHKVSTAQSDHRLTALLNKEHKDLNKVKEKFKDYRQSKSFDEIARLKDAHSITDSFKIRSNNEIDDVVENVLINQFYEREYKKELVRERKYVEKQRDLDRAHARNTPMEIQFPVGYVPNDRDRQRYRDSNEFALTRSQLKKFKEHSRQTKRERKHANRIIDVENQSEEIFLFPYENLLSMGANVFNELLDYVRSKFVGLDTQPLLWIINFVMIMVRSTDTVLRGIALGSLLHSFKVPAKWAIASGITLWFAETAGSKLFEDGSTPSDVEFQMDAGEIRSVLDKTLNSELVHAVRMVFIGMTSYLSFPAELTTKVFNFIGSSPMKMSILKLVENILAIMTKVNSAAALWWYGRDGEAVPISEILFGATLQDGLREAHAELRIYKDSTYAGLPVPEYMCQYMYARKCSEFKTTCRAYLENIGRHNPNYRNITDWLNDVTKWSMDINNRIQGFTRVPPFATVVCGAPGVGKSLTTKLLFSRPAAIKGYKYDESHTYFHNPSQEYFENYRPMEQNGVFFSEVGKETAKRAENSTNPGMDLLLSCIDSGPFAVPMAFEGKGKIFFIAEQLIMDTNNCEGGKYLNLESLYINPAAYLRRFYFIHHSVYEQYRKENSQEVDPEKVAHLDNPYLAYFYRVERFITNGNTKAEPMHVMSGGYLELIEWYDAAFVEHQTRNSALNAKVLEFINSIPSKVNAPVFIPPPKPTSQLELEEVKEDPPRVGYQERFNRPVGAADKFMRNGIFNGVIPKLGGETGREQFLKLLLRAQKYLNNVIGSGKVPAELIKVPSFMGDHFDFKLTKLDFKYINSLAVNKFIKDFKCVRERCSALGMLDIINDMDKIDEYFERPRPYGCYETDNETKLMISGLSDWFVEIAMTLDRDVNEAIEQFGEMSYSLSRLIITHTDTRITQHEVNYVRLFYDDVSTLIHAKILDSKIFAEYDGVREMLEDKEDTEAQSGVLEDIYDEISSVATVFTTDIKQIYIDHALSLLENLYRYFKYQLLTFLIFFMTLKSAVHPGAFAVSTTLLLSILFMFNLNVDVYISFCWFILASLCSKPAFEMWARVGKGNRTKEFVRLLCSTPLLFLIWSIYNIYCVYRGFFVSIICATPFLIVFLHKCIVSILEEQITTTIQKKKEMFKARIADVYYSFLSVRNGLPRADNCQFGWISACAGGAIAIVATAGIALFLVKKFKKMSTSIIPNSGQSKMEQVEDRTGCSSPVRRWKCASDPDHWNTQSAHHPRYPHVQTLESFSKMVRDRTRFCWFRNAKGNMIVNRCLELRKNHVVINTHFHKLAREGKFEIYASRVPDVYYKDYNISIDVFIDGPGDITLATTGLSFKDLSKHVSVATVGSAEGLIDGVEVFTVNQTDMRECNGIKYDSLYRYDGFSKKGYCGNVLVAKVGQGCAILGMHTCGDLIGVVGFAQPLIRTELVSLSEKLSIRSGTFDPMSSPMAGLPASTEECKVNPKSPFSHINLQSIEYFGTVEKAQVNKKSTVEKNIFSVVVPKISNLLGVPVTKEFGPPVMMPFTNANKEYISPQNNALVYFCKPPVMRNEFLYSRVAKMLKNDILIRLKDEGHSLKLSPYKMTYAINGSREDEFLRRISVSTAAGFPLKGKKSQHLILQDDDYTRVPTEQVVNMMYDIVGNYLNGERSNSVFTVSLKDEPVPRKKIIAGQTRFFYVHPLPHLILSRMYLGPIVTLIQASDAFYSMVGINMFNNADKVYEKLTRHPMYLEADAKKFDISVSYVVRAASFHLVELLMIECGYSEDAMVIVRGLLSDLLNPLYMLDGDLFSKSSVPSGHYGTAELNCLIILTIMYAVFVKKQDDGIIPQHVKFFDEVSAALYGDDQSTSVSELVSAGLNNVTVADMYEEMNMELTASDKASELLPFVPIQDATFLKRSIYNINGNIYAPLDCQSIYKMTTWSLRPDGSTYMERDRMIANSAITEIALHLLVSGKGEREFNEIVAIFSKRYSEVYKIIPNLHNYDKVLSLMGKFDTQSGTCPYNIVVWEGDHTDNHICHENLNSNLNDECVIVTGARRLHPGPYNKIDENLSCTGLVTTQLVPVRERSSIDNLLMMKKDLQVQLESEEKEFEAMDPLYDLSFPAGVKYTNRYAADLRYREYADRWLEKYSVIEDIRIRISAISETMRRERNAGVEFQSGEQSTGEITDSVVEEHGTLSDIGGMETKEISIGSDNTVRMVSAPSSLVEFFARPIDIGSFQTVVGGTVENIYDPLDLYLTDPVVRSKIRNCAFMKASVCVRISVSGTPFDSGRLMVSCQPYVAHNPSYNALFAVGATWDRLKLQYLSQSKLSTVIDVKENRPVDLKMPWISPAPIGRLFNSGTAAIGTASSLTDFAGMWRLVIKTLNPLASITASPSPVFVYLYAWLEDVQIGVPTGTQMAVTTQSDERETGPVENVASNLYKISKSLESAPYISIYAKASSFVLGAVRGLSALFGWSAPVLQMVPHRVKNEPFQNGTNYIQNDTGQRLVWDPKQELAISTDYVNSMEDELVISNIVSKQTYFTQFTWNAATLPRSNIYNFAIHPRLSHGFTGPVNLKKNVVPTPMDWMAQLFQKWRGNIVLSFEVVCSSLHRGKLLIQWDPNVMQYALIVANTNLNKQYTHVWDIQETQRYSVCIKWAHLRAWAENLDNADCYNNLHGSSLTPVTSWINAVNGFVFISPLTKLQSPDGSNVTINVYIHGEEIEFNRACSNKMPKNRAIDWQADERVANVEESCIPINDGLISAGVYDHYYGEKIVSLRSMMKRFIEHRYAAFTPAPNAAYLYRGTMYPSNPYTVGTDGTASVTGLSVFNHIRQAFLAMRGSMRHRIQNICDTSNNFSPTYVILRDDENTSSTTTSTQAIDGFNIFPSGALTYIQDTNAGVEFEVPFYSNNLYVWSCEADPYNNVTNDPTDPILTRGFTIVSHPSGTPAIFAIRDHIATGEDFQMSYFLGSVPYVST